MPEPYRISITRAIPCSIPFVFAVLIKTANAFLVWLVIKDVSVEWILQSKNQVNRRSDSSCFNDGQEDCRRANKFYGIFENSNKIKVAKRNEKEDGNNKPIRVTIAQLKFLIQMAIWITKIVIKPKQFFYWFCFLQFLVLHKMLKQFLISRAWKEKKSILKPQKKSNFIENRKLNSTLDVLSSFMIFDDIKSALKKVDLIKFTFCWISLIYAPQFPPIHLSLSEWKISLFASLAERNFKHQRDSILISNCCQRNGRTLIPSRI